MKKIFLIVMSFFILTQTINANRDRVYNVSYEWEFDIKSKATYDLINEYCWTKSKRTVDLWRYLNHTGKVGIAKWMSMTWNCNYSGWILNCKYNTPRYSWGLLYNKITPHFEASWKDLIWPQVEWTLKFYLVNSTLNITIDDLWEPINNKFKSLVDNNLHLWTFRYKNSNECSHKVPSKEVTEWVLKDPKKPELWKKEVTKEVPWDPIVTDITWTIGGNEEGEVRDKPEGLARIDSIKVANSDLWKICSLSEWIYNCYASEKISFEVDWKYNSTTIFINDKENNNPACLDKKWRSCESSINNWNFFRDSKIITSDLFKKAWDWNDKQCYTIEVVWRLKKDSFETSSNTKNLKLCIVPNPDEIIWTIENEFKKYKTNWQIYANNKDSYEYEVLFTDKFKNVIKNKKIETLTCSPESECLKYSNNKNGLVTKFNNELVTKLNNLGTSLQWKAKFEITSSVPNKYENWRIENVKPWFIWTVKKWSTTNQDISWIVPVNIKAWWEKIFNEPISFKAGSLIVTGNNINVSKKQAYTIYFDNNWKLTPFEWNIEWMNSSNNLVLNGNNKDFELKDISDSNKGISNSKLEAWFTATAIAKFNDKIKSAISLTMKNLKIKYSFNWYNISYDIRDNIWLDTCKVDTTWLILNGKTLAKWKESHTSEVSTFTNISKADLKKTVDKNAKNLVRWLESWKKYNWVLYFEWDVTYENLRFNWIELKENESLIIKNWNLLIKENISENIWIVVLADKVDLTKIDWTSKWNIFVKNTVKEINAYLYADWGLISADNLNWKAYSDEELRVEKLDLNWSLVSSNTVWGWEKWESSCFLPWNKKTDNCDLAERYDLNYLRKRIIQCEGNLTQEQKKNNYSFKVNYNPAIQTKTPKVFKNN